MASRSGPVIGQRLLFDSAEEVWSQLPPAVRKDVVDTLALLLRHAQQRRRAHRERRHHERQDP